MTLLDSEGAALPQDISETMKQLEGDVELAMMKTQMLINSSLVRLKRR
ncbi:hypothetical protein OH492_19075 [Vibrio chagasii]|nr:hypothetical protein [Vibrio chagasii]